MVEFPDESQQNVASYLTDNPVNFIDFAFAYNATIKEYYANQELISDNFVC